MSDFKQFVTRKNIIILVVLLAFFIMPQMITSPFIEHSLFMIFIWSICGVAWNVLSGSAGQTSLGHAMFFGIGAYVSTMLFLHLNITPWVGLFAAAAAACIAAFLCSRFMFKLSGFYFAIGTIALSEIVLVLFTSWRFVGSARGLFIPMYRGAYPFLTAMQSLDKVPYIYTAMVLLLLCIAGSYYMSLSRAGYYFRAIRDEPEAAESLGIDIRRYKTIAYMFSAAFCAMAGVLYAHYAFYIDPDSTMHSRISVQIAIVAILGGINSLWGPIVGAAVLVTVSEWARLNLGGTGQAVDLLLYSLCIILFAVYQPNGIVGLIKSILRKINRNKRLQMSQKM